MTLFVMLCPVGLIVSCSINGTLCYVMSRGFNSELFYKCHVCCVMSRVFDRELFYK